MAREIALLTNPTSGKGKGARYREAALPRLRDAGLVVRNLEGRDADEALDLARASVADGVEALVVCGGDGLVHLAAQVLAGTGIPLGIIPAGTGNDVARYFDLPRKDPVAAADRVIGSRIRTVDLARAGSSLLRHRPRRRLRRHRQRAGQRDDVAARPDALQPRHPPRAAHVPTVVVHPRPRRRRPRARRDARRGRQRHVVRRRPPHHRRGPARRRIARRRHHQHDDQARADPHLPEALLRHPHRGSRSTNTTGSAASRWPRPEW